MAFTFFSKDIVERYPCIDLRMLLKLKAVIPGETVPKTITFKHGLKFDCRSELSGKIWGSLNLTSPTGRFQIIEIISTRPHYGGYRYWLRCPTTGKKYAKLYYDGSTGEFMSREALNLAYRSQCLDPISRLAEKAKKGRLQLGGEPNLFAPFPEKPKYMRHRTYFQIRQKALSSQNLFFNSIRK